MDFKKINDKNVSLLASNAEFEQKLKDFNAVLKNYQVSEEDIIAIVKKICAHGKIKLADKLINLLKQLYLNDDIFEHNSQKSNALKNILINTIELYEKNAKLVSSEIRNVLIEAKKLNLSPYSIALKTNIQIATVENFEETLSALTREKYKLNQENEESLFTQNEYQTIMHQCASIACRVNAENLHQIIEMLRDFAYDKETGGYFFNIKELFIKAPSILPTTPKKMQGALDLLTTIADKRKVIEIIRNSPSILSISKDNYNNNVKICSEIIFSLKKKLNHSLTLEAFKKSLDYSNMLNKFFQFNHIETVAKAKSNELKTKANFLEKILGTQNAIYCMSDMAILNADFEELKFVLSYIAKIDLEHNATRLKVTFVKNPSKFLNFLKLDKSIQKILTPDSADKNKDNNGKKDKNIDSVENSVDKNSFPKINTNELYQNINFFSFNHKKMFEKFTSEITDFDEKLREENKKKRKNNYFAKTDVEPQQSNIESESSAEDNNSQASNDNALLDNSNDRSSAQSNTKDDNKNINTQTPHDNNNLLQEGNAGVLENEDNKTQESENLIQLSDFKSNIKKYVAYNNEEKNVDFYAYYMHIINQINNLFYNLPQSKRAFIWKKVGSNGSYIEIDKLKNCIKLVKKIENLKNTLIELLDSPICYFDLNSSNNEYKQLVADYINEVWIKKIEKIKESIATYKNSINKLFEKLKDIDKEIYSELFENNDKLSDINTLYYVQKFFINKLLSISNQITNYYSQDVLTTVFGNSDLATEQTIDDNQINANQDLIQDYSNMINLHHKRIIKFPVLSLVIKKIIPIVKFGIEKRKINLRFDNISELFKYLSKELHNKSQEKTMQQSNNTDTTRFQKADLDYLHKSLQIIEDFADSSWMAKIYYGPNDTMYLDIGIDLQNKNVLLAISQSEPEYIEPNINTAKSSLRIDKDTIANSCIISRDKDKSK